MLRTSDQGMVEVILNEQAQVIPQGNFAMIFGRVDEEGERLREFRTINMGDKLGEYCVLKSY